MSQYIYNRRYRDSSDGLCDWKYILKHPGVDRHLITRNTHSIFATSLSHALLPSFLWSSQFVWFIMPGNPFTSSYPLPTILVPELRFLSIFLQMTCDVGRSVDDGLTAYRLMQVTTLWSSKHRDALGVHGQVSLAMHLEAMIIPT